MAYAKISAGSDGIATYNFAYPPTDLSKVYAFATVRSPESESVTFAVSVIEMTTEYVKFRVRRIEQASGLIGAILTTFFKPAANHSADLDVQVAIYS